MRGTAGRGGARLGGREARNRARQGMARQGKARNGAIKLIKERINETISNHIERADTTTDA